MRYHAAVRWRSDKKFIINFKSGGIMELRCAEGVHSFCNLHSFWTFSRWRLWNRSFFLAVLFFGKFGTSRWKLMRSFSSRWAVRTFTVWRWQGGFGKTSIPCLVREWLNQDKRICIFNNPGLQLDRSSRSFFSTGQRQWNKTGSSATNCFGQIWDFQGYVRREYADVNLQINRN